MQTCEFIAVSLSPLLRSAARSFHLDLRRVNADRFSELRYNFVTRASVAETFPLNLKKNTRTRGIPFETLDGEFKLRLYQVMQ